MTVAELPDQRNSFEQGPIRPPSEARSLLIRVTRNCPWNRCSFCHTYQGTRFSLRPVAEVKQDILNMARMAEQIRKLSEAQGEGGAVGQETARQIFSDTDDFTEAFRSVAAWLYYGGDSVFLQDANSLIVKTDDLLEILDSIRELLPSVRRITTYARARTAAKKSLADLVRLRAAGLSRIHVGMESACDPLLDFIKKGTSAAEQIVAGQKIKQAGISLCEYVMPGLGGKRWSREHAMATAQALNQINPDHIRLRTLQIVPGSALAEKHQAGEFEPLDEEATLSEIRLFCETLAGITSQLVSDHMLNLLEELEGRLPEDRGRILGVIERYFSLPAEARMVFRLGRRMGVYRRLDDLRDNQTYQHLARLLAESQDPQRYLAEVRRRYI